MANQAYFLNLSSIKILFSWNNLYTESMGPRVRATVVKNAK